VPTVASPFLVSSAQNEDAESRKITLFYVAVVLLANLELCPVAKVNLVALYLPRVVQNM
jgi:hypothetical protein